MPTGIYILKRYDIINLSNERGTSCMKLTNNLTVDQAFKAYPYNVSLLKVGIVQQSRRLSVSTRKVGTCDMCYLR